MTDSVQREVTRMLADAPAFGRPDRYDGVLERDTTAARPQLKVAPNESAKRTAQLLRRHGTAKISAKLQFHIDASESTSMKFDQTKHSGMSMSGTAGRSPLV